MSRFTDTEPLDDPSWGRIQAVGPLGHGALVFPVAVLVAAGALSRWCLPFRHEPMRACVPNWSSCGIPSNGGGHGSCSLGHRMVSRFLTAVSVAALLPLTTAANVARAEDHSLIASCPAYPSHLRAAREHLARGDRTGAVAELRRADEALQSCLREEAAGASLLAGHARRTPSS